MTIENGRIPPYPQGDIKLIESNRPEFSNVRFLVVDITPAQLKTELRSPLRLEVTELLPIADGKPLPPTSLLEKIRRWGPGGCAINSGTHQDEATSENAATLLRGSLIDVKDRALPVIFMSGIAEATETLRALVIKKGLMDDPNVDINRQFIGPFDIPQNPFQEMTQKIVWFFLSRYYFDKLAFIDVHTDPMEFDVRPHIILDRTLPSTENNDFYQWTLRAFPALSVVWDLPKDQYFKEGFQHALPAVLLAHQQRYSVTYESSAGTGVAYINSLRAQYNLILSLEQIGVISEEKSYELLSGFKNQLNSLDSDIITVATANSLLSGQELRREWINLPIPYRGTFVPLLPEIMHNVLSSSGSGGGKLSILGIFYAAGIPPRQTLMRLPSNIKKAVLLGVPNVGILSPDLDKKMYVSLAVPE